MHADDLQASHKRLQDPNVNDFHLVLQPPPPSPVVPERKLLSLAPLAAAPSDGLYVLFPHPGLTSTGRAEMHQ